MKARIPEDEDARIQALKRYEILDSEAEAEFDDFTALASHICGTPISLVSLVDTDRQWFKSVLGLSVTELSRDSAFCAHTILEDEVLEVADTYNDARFRDNPLVSGDPNIRFYAGAPLVTEEGLRLGSLCVIDREPRELSPDQRDALSRLSRQVVRQMELRIQRKKLADSYRRLHETESLRDSLVHMVVHDLRTPLGAIMGYLQLAEMGELSDEESRYIGSAMGHAEELLRMIDTLLDVSRLESGEMSLALKSVDLREFMEDGLKRFDVMKEGREISTDFCADLKSLYCDPLLLVRVFQNLLGNAFRFTDQDEGVISIGVTCDDETAFFRIEDNGPGIPEEHCEAVFDKFFQIEHKYTTGHSSGLGLAFCKLAIQAHGGTIRAASNAEAGACFEISLPLAGPKRGTAT